MANQKALNQECVKTVKPLISVNENETIIFT